MELAKIKVSVPIIEFSNVVKFSTQRKPVALEWALLEMLKTFEKQPIQIVPFFNTVMKVPQAEELLEIIIDRLFQLGVIQLNDLRYDVSTLQLSDITLTPRGKELVLKGSLPTAMMEERLYGLYNPHSQEILGDILTGSKLELALDKGLILKDAVYPKEQFRQYIERNQKSNGQKLIQKFDPSTLISEVVEEPRRRKLKWQNKTVSFEINEFGELTIKGITRVECKALLHLFEDQIELLMAHVFGRISDQNYLLPQTQFMNLALTQVKQQSQLEHEIETKLHQSKVSLIQNTELTIEQIQKDLKTKKNKTRLVILNNNQEEVIVHRGNHIIIQSSENLFEKLEVNHSFHYLDDKFNNILCANLLATYDQKSFRLPIMYAVEAEKMSDDYNITTTKFNQIIDDYLNDVIQKTNDVFLFLAKRTYQEDECVWSELMQYMRDTNEPITYKIEMLQKLNEAFIKSNSKFKQPLDEHLCELICADLKQSRDEPLDYNVYFKALKIDSILKNPVLNEKLGQVVIKQLSEPTTYDELITLHLLFESIGINKCLILINYSSSIIKSLLNKYEDTTFIQQLKHYSTIEIALKDLKKLELNLKLDELSQSTVDGISQLKAYQIRDYLLNVGKWQERYQQCCLEINHFEDVIKQTTLEKVKNTLASYMGLFKKYNFKMNKECKRLYILDSDVLLEIPDILEKFKYDEHIIVSSTIHQNLKQLDVQDEEIRERIQTNLKQYPSSKLSFVTADETMVPLIYNVKEKAHLLAVAFKYLTISPTLITNDSSLSEVITRMGVFKLMNTSQFLTLRKNYQPQKNRKRKTKK